MNERSVINMSPRKPEEFELIRNESKARIQMAALEVFAESGYHSASISQIAKKAGVSKGLMYNYFESKEQLLEQVVEGLYQDGIRDFEVDIWETLDGLGKLNWVINKSFEGIKKNLNINRLLTMLIIQKDIGAVVVKMLMEKKKAYADALEIILAELGSENAYKDSLLISALLNGVFIQYLYNQVDYPLDMMKEMIGDHIKKNILHFNSVK